MTRIELKFKISYGAIREILFQTAMRLSFKKKKKKARPYKKKQPLIHGTNRWKKKSLCNKNPKTQIVFPDQNSYSLRLPILRCSFKHTDRTCVFQPIKQTKKKKPLQQLKPLQRWKSPFVPCNRGFISYPASALQQ